jgi:hypothetical protein
MTAKTFFSWTIATVIVGALASQAARCAEDIHEGKVLAVSDGTLMLLDDRDDDTDSFTVTADTKVLRNGKPAKLSDIQPGDMAVVTATSVGGTLMAKEIVARTPM